MSSNLLQNLRDATRAWVLGALVPGVVACGSVVPTVDDFAQGGDDAFAGLAWAQACPAGATPHPFGNAQAPHLEQHLLRSGNAGRLDVYCSRKDGAPLALSWIVSGLIFANQPTWPPVPKEGQPVPWSDGAMPRHVALHAPGNTADSALVPTLVPGLWRQLALRTLSSYSGEARVSAWFRFLDRARFEAEFGALLLDQQAFDHARSPDGPGAPLGSGARGLVGVMAGSALQRHEQTAPTLPAPAEDIAGDFAAVSAAATALDATCLQRRPTGTALRALLALLDRLDGPRAVPVVEPPCTPGSASPAAATLAPLQPTIAAFGAATPRGKRALLAALTAFQPAHLTAPVRARLAQITAELLVNEAKPLATSDALGAAGRAWWALGLLDTHGLAAGAPTLVAEARALVAPAMTRWVLPALPHPENAAPDPFDFEEVPAAKCLGTYVKRADRTGPTLSMSVVRPPRTVGTSTLHKVSKFMVRRVRVPEMVAAPQPAPGNPAWAAKAAELARLEEGMDVLRAKIGLENHQPCVPDRDTRCNADGTMAHKTVDPSEFMRVNLQLSGLEDRRQSLAAEVRALQAQGGVAPQSTPVLRPSGRMVEKDEGYTVMVDAPWAPVTARAEITVRVEGFPPRTVPLEEMLMTSTETPPILTLGPGQTDQLERMLIARLEPAALALARAAQREVLEAEARRLGALSASDGAWFRVLAGLEPAPEDAAHLKP